jgi:methylmalonyl-CoA/ethylmalonyl-CoA epimerase
VDVLVFHHVGVGTTAFEAAIEVYVKLGHTVHVNVDDPVLDVRIALLACPGDAGPWLEVVAPLGPNGPLRALAARRALPTPYHTCYAVDDLTSGAAALADAGFAPVSEPAPALAFDNARIAFFFSASVGLVELLERPPIRLLSPRLAR